MNDDHNDRREARLLKAQSLLASARGWVAEAETHLLARNVNVEGVLIATEFAANRIRSAVANLKICELYSEQRQVLVSAGTLDGMGLTAVGQIINEVMTDGA